MVNSFVHLRTHSEYSITQGMVRIPELCDRAVEYGMSSLALSDMDNLFGAVKFYSAARKRGLKPIIGCDVAVYTPGGKVPSRLLLLVQDKDGYLKLSRWLTRAYVGEERETRAAIHSDWIQAEGSHGLIALSGWKDGDVERSLMDDDPQEGARKIKYWSDLFEGRFYLEIQRSNKDGNRCFGGERTAACRARKDTSRSNSSCGVFKSN
jgi:DNA polymerase-3 subunit alpha